MKVPIQNIYYLLCYACAERISTSELESAGVVEGPDSLPNLLRYVFARRLKALIRRGLDRNYLGIQEETAIPRGRIDFNASITSCSMRRHTLVSRQDELNVNVLHNQVLRTTAHILANHPRIERRHRMELGRIERMMHGIDVVRPNPLILSRIHLHRNNLNYRFLLLICQLVWMNLLPEPDRVASPSQFEAIQDDDRAMERIFEEFIGNFYHLEMPTFHVKTQQRLDWDAGPQSDFRYLPVMRADAVLRSKQSGRIWVIDAKYYRDALVTFHERERVRSGHLYQITAYLRSIKLKGTKAEGLLLYPQTGSAVSANFHLSGRDVRVRSLDLTRPWPEVHRSLCDLVTEPANAER